MKRLLTTRSLLGVFCALVQWGLVPNEAWGQATARLTGMVKDQSGAIVAGASVTLTNQGTNVSRTTKTDGEGNYLFSLVEVGTYRLTVEHTGFKKNVQSGITLELNQNGRLDVTLEVGQTTQVVEVTAAVPQIDTTGAVLGKVEDERRLQDLPILDREQGTLSLGLLQAGVFAKDQDDGSGNPFSVSGQRSESMTFLLDGGDNTDFLSNRIVQNPIPDAVQEFKILTNNYDAQYGRTSGGIINQVIKSGTNSIHGDAFEYWRNDVLNANDFFLNASGVPRTSFKRNLFGGTIGAPIKKDKTFIFGAYQANRRREGQISQILQVLSPAERGCGANATPGCVGTMGDFSEICPEGFNSSGNCMNPANQLINPVTGGSYSNNQVPVNPVIANYIKNFLPLPNLSGNRFIASPVARIRDDQFVIRADHNLTSHDTLSFVYVFEDVSDLFPFSVNKGASTGGNVPVGSAFTDATRRDGRWGR